MKLKWIGLPALALIAVAIIGYKSSVSPQTQASTGALPRVLLVADLNEADSSGDACADIIHLVRAARDRGVAVQELNPDSKSDLLTRYNVLAIPTVLILDRAGEVTSRFEGEGGQTVTALRAALDQLQ